MIYSGKIEIEGYFSDDLTRRYYLKREYKSNKFSFIGNRKLCYILINPSFSDELLFDKTNMLACNIGVRNGFDEIVILNMYSLITKNKKQLKKSLAIGNDVINDKTILDECLGAHKIILSWGTDSEFQDRRKILVDMLNDNDLIDKTYKIVYTDKNGKLYNAAHLSMYLTDNPCNFKVEKLGCN